MRRDGTLRCTGLEERRVTCDLGKVDQRMRRRTGRTAAGGERESEHGLRRRPLDRGDMHSSCQRPVATYPDKTGEQVEKELHDGLEDGKERFKDLNDRFAKYINNTILSLMRKNKDLLAELKLAEKEENCRVEAIFQKARCDLKLRLEEQQKELNCLKADKEKYKKRSVSPRLGADKVLDWGLVERVGDGEPRWKPWCQESF
ncbi:hypothetical protein chiPu_0018258 [Chiloscyllium punctatum]|uniref:Uncharacterized protein n=1 Tax=Chiloscyllium punctatum TaxID=137246 RepID=A0A401RM05_CHIPU|nr:hypothetical protein [Chiloscyllium punctatum]